MNVNRLITESGRSKVGFLYDQAVKNNSVFVGVTETWLHAGIVDAEVTHSFPGYSLFRADKGRDKGSKGVIRVTREGVKADKR